MRLTSRDVLATLFVATAAVVYAVWVTGAAMTGLSTRVVAAVVFGLGWAACMANQNQMAVVYGTSGGRPRPPAVYIVLASAVGALALVTGIIALVTASEAMLAVLLASMAGLWVIATARHALARPAYGAGNASRGPAKTA
jgi:hypothetical protein